LAAGRRGIIHGDLNPQNIIVEYARGGRPEAYHDEAWLIDFAFTRRDVISFDYAELETSLLCSLIRPIFFGRPGQSRKRLTEEVVQFLSHLHATPWQLPPCAKRDDRLAFIYQICARVRGAAENNGVCQREYLYARTLSFLLTHRINAGDQRRKSGAAIRNQFAAQVAWLGATVSAGLLGWIPSSE